MQRHVLDRLFVPALAASLLTLAAAGVALGKCEDGSPEADNPACQAISATLETGGSMAAGATTTVSLWVSQGEQPFWPMSAEVVFHRIADGTTLTVALDPAAEEGRFTADVNLPQGGHWTVVAQVRDLEGRTAILPLETIRVRDLPAPTVDRGRSSPAAPLNVPAWPWALLGGVLAMGLGAAALRGRRRQPSPA